MSEEANEAAKAAREAMELLKRKRLTKEEKGRLQELLTRWRGARDHAWQEAEERIEATMRRQAQGRHASK
ncbi:hypothetical protein ACFLST_01765 [Chloroflexota bacterium]